MRIVLETHRYAPELNKAFVGPTATVVPVPGCTTIAQVRQKLFSPVARRGRHVVLSTHYPEDKAWLNRQHSGFCDDLRTLAIHLRDLRARLAPGLGACVKVRSWLIG